MWVKWLEVPNDWCFQSFGSYLMFLEVNLCLGEEYPFSKVSCGLIINLSWDAFCCPGCWFMSRIFDFELLTVDKDRTSTSTFYCLCSMCWELMHKAIRTGIICCFKIISTGTRKSDAKFSEGCFVWGSFALLRNQQTYVGRSPTSVRCLTLVAIALE